MAELRIMPVKSEGEIEAFISLPWRVYADNPYWVPPFPQERKQFLDPKRNAFFEHGTAEYFLAKRGEEVVGTIAAITNDLYNEFQEVNTGFFGFFEVLKDPEAAGALLQRAETWAREAGHDTILGPAQFSTNDECGLLVDGFDDRPRILMTYNPPRYKDYLEAAGYEKVMDLWAHALSVEGYESRIPPKLLRVVDKIKARGKFKVRQVDLKKFDREVEIIKHIYNNSWARNWGFVPMTDAEMDHLANSLKPIIDPSLALFVEYEGEAVGFGLCLPDLNEPLLLAFSRPNVPDNLTMLKMVWHWKVRRKVEWLRVFVLGVLPEHRGKGVDALMYLEMAKNAMPKGYKMVEMSWILENNMMMNRSIELLGGEVYKTYRMYEKRV